MFREETLDEIQNTKKKQIYKVGESYDCPAFLGLYNFCMLSAGASIDCATSIISNRADIAINWVEDCIMQRNASQVAFVMSMI